MLVCSRCGAEISQKDEYCSVCGLSREGGKGRICSVNEDKSHEDKKIQFIDPDGSEIPDAIKTHEIWRYYDMESLTQENVNSELKRLHKVIESLENILISMEADEPEHPDIMEFYKERIKLTTQLDVIYGFLNDVYHERINDFIKDSDLKILYGKLPEWRITQLKKRKAYKYYYLDYK